MTDKQKAFIKDTWLAQEDVLDQVRNTFNDEIIAKFE
jgi:hypothetical protein